jgi:hypothetical protein
LLTDDAIAWGMDLIKREVREGSARASGDNDERDATLAE